MTPRLDIPPGASPVPIDPSVSLVNQDTQIDMALIPAITQPSDDHHQQQDPDEEGNNHIAFHGDCKLW